MSKDNNHSDKRTILDYLKDKLSNRERHAFEKKMLHDDFEAEAFEGMAQFPSEELESDLKMLDIKIKNRQKTKPRSIGMYWRAAAVLLLVSAVTITIFNLGFENIPEQSTLSKEEQPTEEKQTEQKNSTPATADTAAFSHDKSITMNREQATDSEPEKEEAKTVQPAPKTNTQPTQSSQETSGDAIAEEEIMIEDTFVEPLDPVAPTEDEKTRELVGTPEPYALDRTGVGEVPSSPEISRYAERDEERLSRMATKPAMKKSRAAESAEVADQDEITRSDVESMAAPGDGHYGADTPLSTTIAQPVGGFEKFNAFIAEVKNAALVNNEEAEKVVVLELTIGENGELTDISVEQNPGRKYVKDAIAVIEKWQAGWSPGIINDQPVQSRLKVEIKY